MKKPVYCAIPCYNESYNLPDVFNDLEKNNISHFADVVFIDDCSKDNSVNLIEQSGHQLIKHSTNQGYGQAIQSAFSDAVSKGYRSFIVFPGDGQRSAKDLLLLIELDNQSRFDVIYGSKFHIYSDKYGPIQRRIGNIIYANIAKYGWNSPVKDVLSGFKIYRISSVKKFFGKLPKGYPFDICFSLYASRFGLQVTEVDVACRYDEHTSKMKSVLWVSMKLMLHLIIHFFMQPFIVKASNESITLQEAQSRN